MDKFQPNFENVKTYRDMLQIIEWKSLEKLIEDKRLDLKELSEHFDVQAESVSDLIPHIPHHELAALLYLEEGIDRSIKGIEEGRDDVIIDDVASDLLDEIPHEDGMRMVNNTGDPTLLDYLAGSRNDDVLGSIFYNPHTNLKKTWHKIIENGSPQLLDRLVDILSNDIFDKELIVDTFYKLPTTTKDVAVENLELTSHSIDMLEKSASIPDSNIQYAIINRLNVVIEYNEFINGEPIINHEEIPYVFNTMESTLSNPLNEFQENDKQRLQDAINELKDYRNNSIGNDQSFDLSL